MTTGLLRHYSARGLSSQVRLKRLRNPTLFDNMTPQEKFGLEAAKAWSEITFKEDKKP